MPIIITSKILTKLFSIIISVYAITLFPFIILSLINIGHGEGYGLPMFEAAYSGLPVITCGWGGQCDFLYAPTKTKNGRLSFRMEENRP